MCIYALKTVKLLNNMEITNNMGSASYWMQEVVVEG